jgi:hypothetical protein
VERTRVLHVVDASGALGRDPPPTSAWFAMVRLPACLLSGRSWWRPRDLEGAPAALPALERAAANLGLEVVPVSAVTGDGLVRLKRRLLATLAAARAFEPVAEGA